MNKKILFLLLGVMHGGFLLQAMELSGNMVPIQKNVNSIGHGTTLQSSTISIIPFTAPQTEKRVCTIKSLVVCKEEQSYKEFTTKDAVLGFRENSKQDICGCLITIGQDQYSLVTEAHEQLVSAIICTYNNEPKNICFLSKDLKCKISLEIPKSITKEQLEKYYEGLKVQLKQTANNNTVGGTEVDLTKEQLKKYHEGLKVQLKQTANNNTVGDTKVDVTKVLSEQKTFLQNLVSVIFTKQGLAVGSILALIICGVLYKYNKLSFA